jgi:hypothetical protein
MPEIANLIRSKVRSKVLEARLDKATTAILNGRLDDAATALAEPKEPAA